MDVKFQENDYVVAYCYDVENPMDALAPDAKHFSSICCRSEDFAQHMKNTDDGEVIVIQYFIKAASWEECMAIFELREHGSVYHPMGEGKLCPKCESFFYFPDGSGHCPKCGEIK